MVTIGNQTWMAQNLNYETSDSWCNQCEIYGRLYTWDAAMSACPSGWHLPSDYEWKTLVDVLGGKYEAGGKLKSTSSSWNSPNTGATNESGFSVIPSGFYDMGYSSFGNKAAFWTSTEESNNVYSRNWFFSFQDTKADPRSPNKGCGFSVRCIKD